MTKTNGQRRLSARCQLISTMRQLAQFQSLMTGSNLIVPGTSLPYCGAKCRPRSGCPVPLQFGLWMVSRPIDGTVTDGDSRPGRFNQISFRQTSDV
jgi:hypothetical protein